jgi:hypothetical protein
LVLLRHSSSTVTTPGASLQRRRERSSSSSGHTPCSVEVAPGLLLTFAFPVATDSESNQEVDQQHREPAADSQSEAVDTEPTPG